MIDNISGLPTLNYTVGARRVNMTFTVPDAYSNSVGIKDYCGLRVLTCKLDAGATRQNFFTLVTDNTLKSYNFSAFTTNKGFIKLWDGNCKATLKNYPLVAALNPTFKV